MDNLRFLPTVRTHESTPSMVNQYQQMPPMESMPQELGTLSLMTLFDIVRRNFLLGVLLVSLCAIGSVMCTFFITPQYKSKAVLNIQSSYFQEPLVGDLISQVYDQSELRERRDSLIQTAFSDEFMLSLLETIPGVKSDLGFDLADKDLSNQRTQAVLLYVLRDKLEHFGLSASTFHVSALASTPELALELTQAYVNQVTKQLGLERMKLLENSRSAIANHIRELSRELSAIEQSLQVGNEDVLLDQVTRLKADLEALLVQYTERHPKVSRLKQEVRSSQTRLEAFRQSAIRSRQKETGVFSKIERSAAAKEPTQDVYNELLKKLSYLQIALSMEADDGSQHIRILQQPAFPIEPTFPRKDLFALFGGLIGILLWIVGVTIRETRPRIQKRKISKP